MRLSDSARTLVMGNAEILNKCRELSVDINKFKRCNIEQMGNHYVFILSKDNVPKSKCVIPLDTDIDSQPDIVLIVTAENGKLTFETTEYTPRILRINNRKKV